MATADAVRRRRALLIASGTYLDPGLARLRAPTADVRALAEVLGDDAIGGFDVRQAVDESTENVKREIEGFFVDSRLDDLLLLYFSGHGVLTGSGPRATRLCAGTAPPRATGSARCSRSCISRAVTSPSW